MVRQPNPQHLDAWGASMRPRLGSRGWSGASDTEIAAARASMRPRLGSRGWFRNGERSLLTHSASMRPRLGSRGWEEVVARSVVNMKGFNETTAWEPWMDSTTPNQVTIAAPASMRPRLGSRGWELDYLEVLQKRLQLQ